MVRGMALVVRRLRTGFLSVAVTALLVCADALAHHTAHRGVISKKFDTPKSIFSVVANFDDCVRLNRFVDNCVVSATKFIPNTPKQNAEAS